MKIIHNKLILGTANFGKAYGITKKVVKKNEIKKICNLIDKKKNLVDTAIKYDLPKNKSRILNNFKIITKVDFTKKKNIQKFILNKIKISLKNYNLKSFDTILLHNSKILKDHKATEYISVLKNLKKLRYCKSIGVSIYEPDEIGLIIKHFKPDIIQIPFNIFDQRIAKSKWLRYLIKNNINVHVRSIFLQKILLLDAENRPKYFKRWVKFFLNFEKICKKYKLSKIQVCLNYVFQFKFIKGVVVGVDSADQLKQIMTAKIIKNKNIFKELESLSNNSLKLIDPRKWNF